MQPTKLEFPFHLFGSIASSIHILQVHLHFEFIYFAVTQQFAIFCMLLFVWL